MSENSHSQLDEESSEDLRFFSTSFEEIHLVDSLEASLQQNDSQDSSKRFVTLMSHLFSLTTDEELANTFKSNIHVIQRLKRSSNSLASKLNSCNKTQTVEIENGEFNYIADDGYLVDLTQEINLMPSSDDLWKSMIMTSDFILNATNVLKASFQHNNFRDGQLQAIAAILAKQDVILNMKTGFGKSVCFTIPALMTEGTSLIISPLLALITDQLEKMKTFHIASCKVVGDTPEEETTDICREMTNVKCGLKIIFTTPEILIYNSHFTSALKTMSTQHRLQRIIVDEAHSILTWGLSFRPDLLLLRNIKTMFQVPIVLATATANNRMKAILISHMKLINHPITLTSTMVQNNITRSLCYKSKNVPQQIHDFIISHPSNLKNESAIIYCKNKYECEYYLKQLNSMGLQATCYHASLPQSTREENQTSWYNNDHKIMIATVAFEVGIDKSNVRLVLHTCMPDSIEAYYQQSGRCGRDGKPSFSHVLFSYDFNETLFNVSEDKNLNQRVKLFKIRALTDIAEVFMTKSTCIQTSVLKYFDEQAGPCGRCTHCISKWSSIDVTEEARTILTNLEKLNMQYKPQNKHGFTVNELSNICKGIKGSNQALNHTLECTGVFKNAELWGALKTNIVKNNLEDLIYKLIHMEFIKLTFKSNPPFQMSVGYITVQNRISNEDKVYLEIPEISITPSTNNAPPTFSLSRSTRRSKVVNFLPSPMPVKKLKLLETNDSKVKVTNDENSAPVAAIVKTQVRVNDKDKLSSTVKKIDTSSVIQKPTISEPNRPPIISTQKKFGRKQL